MISLVQNVEDRMLNYTYRVIQLSVYNCGSRLNSQTTVSRESKKYLSLESL